MAEATDRALPLAEHANLHFVTPNLAIGGDLSSEDEELSLRQVREIESLGITHIVDVRSEYSDVETFSTHMPTLRYLHHGMDDAGQSVPTEWFEHAVRWVEDAWREDPDAVVLTHCHMGINRGPSLGFAVLLSQGWDPVDAIAAVRAVRPQANVWYAADALTWWHERNGTDPETAAAQHRALDEWRQAHPLDVIRLVREQREQESPSS